MTDLLDARGRVRSLAPGPGAHDEAIRVASRLAADFAGAASIRDREAIHPEAELRSLSASGLLGLTTPAEFGGTDAGLTTAAEVVRILARADPSVAQLILPHLLNCFFLREVGTRDQQERFLGSVAAGARIGNATVDARGPRGGTTVLRRDDSGTLRLDGVKIYTTGARSADHVVVRVTAEPDQKIAVVVPGTAPGITVNDDWNAFGQRATHSGSISFDDVAVDDSDIIELADLFGPASIFAGVDHVVDSAVDVGIAQAAVDDATRFIGDRPTRAAPAATARDTRDPILVHEFGRLLTKVDAAQALLLRNAQLVDLAYRSAERTPEQIRVANSAGDQSKGFAADTAVEVASGLFELTGTSSTDLDLGLDRHWRNARTHSVNSSTRWLYHSVGAKALAWTPNARSLADAETDG
ncbi:acyl-CoA dehydrogenase family protein [Gordonia soli]|uniref:Dibenzothiophene monooxygenase n=1 Tax=Gordonia soli NBRC 108243 TaxID=1223545 RepID=M0QF36_9ACTN|nr:acyl-CoA dehydrogenase family protein [Gordonia soli]GAC66901.1 putative FMNH2-dependent monooxygenase [Gordonia soli NBRC 108243]